MILLMVADVALRTALSRAIVRRSAQAGRIPVAAFTPSGDRLFTEDGVVQLLIARALRGADLELARLDRLRQRKNARRRAAHRRKLAAALPANKYRAHIRHLREAARKRREAA